MRNQDFENLRQLVSEDPAHLKDECLAVRILLEHFDIDKKQPSITINNIEHKQEKGKDIFYKLIPNEEIYYTLVALSLFTKRIDRENVLHEFIADNWITKHEVLTRWTWMQNQEILKKKGEYFNCLYQCRVGPRNRVNKLDVEFHALLKFLPCYCKQVNNEFLCLNKGESPDFVVVDNQGNKIGIEITQAHLNNNCIFEEKQRDQFVNALEKELQGTSFHIVIWRRPAWSSLNKKFPFIKQWLFQELGKISNQISGDKQKYIELPSLNFEISVCDKIGPSVICFCDEGTGRGYTDGEVVDLCTDYMVVTINDKLSKKRPDIRPCILVIYLNTGLPLTEFQEFQEVKAELTSKIHFQDLQTHFDEVYIYDDNIVVKVF